jgi:hypothetical protein
LSSFVRANTRSASIRNLSRSFFSIIVANLSHSLGAPNQGEKKHEEFTVG